MKSHLLPLAVGGHPCQTVSILGQLLSLIGLFVCEAEIGQSFPF